MGARLRDSQLSLFTCLPVSFFVRNAHFRWFHITSSYQSSVRPSPFSAVFVPSFSSRARLARAPCTRSPCFGVKLCRARRHDRLQSIDRQLHRQMLAKVGKIRCTQIPNTAIFPSNRFAERHAMIRPTMLKIPRHYTSFPRIFKSNRFAKRFDR